MEIYNGHVLFCSTRQQVLNTVGFLRSNKPYLNPKYMGKMVRLYGEYAPDPEPKADFTPMPMSLVDEYWAENGERWMEEGTFASKEVFVAHTQTNYPKPVELLLGDKERTRQIVVTIVAKYNQHIESLKI